MNTARSALLAGLAASALLLSGCGLKEELVQEEAWTPDRTAYEISKDGTVTETVIDTLDQAYYSDSELKTMIDESVAQYNAQAGAERVTVGSYTVAQSAVTLVLTYQSAEDVAQYNQVPFYSGSMLGAQMAGYLFSGDFRAVTDGVTSGTSISSEEPLSHKEYQVLITDGTHEVRVPGTIVYVSANAHTADAYVAVPEQEAVSAQITDESAAAQGTGTAADEQADQSLMYVLYNF